MLILVQEGNTIINIDVIERIYIDKVDNDEDESYGSYTIECRSITEDLACTDVLGYYETLEIAQEILREIMSAYVNEKIYAMPEDVLGSEE